MKLKLNDKFTIPNGASGPNGFSVQVVGLGIDTKFLVNGNGVKNPEQPREMPTVAFVKWLKMNKARKIRLTRP